MKKLLSLILISAFVVSFTVSCGEKPSEGWIDDNTYQLKISGMWDRERYYVEGTTPVDGKEAKPSIMLRQDAKTAAKVQAMRNFQEKMGAQIKSKTGVEDGKLIGDVIQSAMSGVTISPMAVKEEYMESHDAMITYQFSSQGLRQLIDKVTAQILKQKNEGVN